MNASLFWTQNMAIYTLEQISGASTRMASSRARKFLFPCTHVHAKNSDSTKENKRSLILNRTTETGLISTKKSSFALKLRRCVPVEAFTLNQHELYSFNSRGVWIVQTVMLYASQMTRLRSLWRASICFCCQTRFDSIQKCSVTNRSLPKALSGGTGSQCRSKKV